MFKISPAGRRSRCCCLNARRCKHQVRNLSGWRVLGRGCASVGSVQPLIFRLIPQNVICISLQIVYPRHPSPTTTPPTGSNNKCLNAFSSNSLSFCISTPVFSSQSKTNQSTAPTSAARWDTLTDAGCQSYGSEAKRTAPIIAPTFSSPWEWTPW